MVPKQRPRDVTVRAMLPSHLYESAGFAAVAFMLVGLWLNWRRHSLLADIEEAVKNNKLTEEQAWRRTRWLNRAGPLVVFIGVALLVAALWGIAR